MATAKRQPKTEPIENGSNGRASNGRFAPGWKGGPGNPYAKRTAEFRAVFNEVVTRDAMKKIVNAVVKKAQDGDLAAVNIILDRLLGRASTCDVLDRLEALESRFSKR